MARQIIVLEQDSTQSGTNIRFRAAFWLTVAASRQFYFANATATSAVKDGSVSGPELTAIQNGSIHEVVVSLAYLTGTSLAAIEADLQAKFTTEQSDFTNQTGNYANAVLNRYGSFFDGATWTVKANN